MSMMGTMKFIASHPLNRGRMDWLLRYLRWQIASRINIGPTVVKFVNGTCLLVEPGMTGATGNIYTGLHEFEDMAFVLHYLRSTDLFVDIGANVGSYTVLAGAVVNAGCYAVEPVPSTFAHLCRNVALNDMADHVTCLNVALGDSDGTVRFTTGLDTMNHVLSKEDGDIEYLDIPVKRLDDILGERKPSMLKIDVEGFETIVLAGAEKTMQAHDLCAVLLELNGSGKKYGYGDIAIHKRMLGYGFMPFSYDPFSRKLKELNSYSGHGNTLYLREHDKVADRLKSAPKFSVLHNEI